MNKSLTLLALPFLLASCASVTDSPEYQELQSNYVELNAKYEQAASNSKDELLEQVAILKQQNNTLETSNVALENQVQSLEGSNKEALRLLETEKAKLGKTKTAFSNYLMANQRSELAAEHIRSSGWDEISLSAVQQLETDYSSKDVVYVKFTTGIGYYSGWYELGYMASSYNIPRMSFGKSGIAGVVVIGKDGRELSLSKCYECESY
ncbi:hypothetical protein P7M07_17305 [Vibrio parahaemolyticus]|uniref:hypothetical protein n=2 Tax=Vibrio parahaemolyticus TaxID=670 RepID=UPI000407FF25|nr:hypothetical protein [Vibrio parahaemolyticus]MCR9818786.1 hypothetical protein [Vibrio parahaemolyticus]MDG2674782.1 hypothetical protein [Vibrio parahaemolyticus]MDL2044763.1 hypothetical protein [Vibrio parahaemolyticus]TOB92785.1 hypothetical protein CGJ96_21135 [Vibrio parahaemolyticus]HCG5068601.1 hypothetical protein [Vibrio parahaemolyticus]